MERIEQWRSLELGNLWQLQLYSGIAHPFMTSQGMLPPGFVNHETVLDAGDVRIENITRVGSNLDAEIQGYVGHSYQLQKKDDLTSGSQVELK